MHSFTHTNLPQTPSTLGEKKMPGGKTEKGRVIRVQRGKGHNVLTCITSDIISSAEFKEKGVERFPSDQNSFVPFAGRHTT